MAFTAGPNLLEVSLRTRCDPEAVHRNEHGSTSRLCRSAWTVVAGKANPGSRFVDSRAIGSPNCHRDQHKPTWTGSAYSTQPFVWPTRIMGSWERDTDGIWPAQRADRGSTARCACATGKPRAADRHRAR